MRLPSLRAVSVGFFGLLAGLLVFLWGVSICSVAAIIWRPHANAEVIVALIRGRLEIVQMDMARAGTGMFDVEGMWLGAPRKATDVFGAFGYVRREWPVHLGPGGMITAITIPIPFLAAIAALAAYLTYRRFRLTLAAWLSLVVIASIFLAVYAHPYERRHRPSISEWDEP